MWLSVSGTYSSQQTFREHARPVPAHTSVETASETLTGFLMTMLGDMISEITQAMTHGLGLKGIADTIYPYPTQAEAIRKVGDLNKRSRLTPLVKSLFQK